MEKTIDNSFIEEREILIRVFSGYRRWNRVEKEEYTRSISFLISHTNENQGFNGSWLQLV